MSNTGSQSGVKEWIRAHFPRAFAAARDVKDQILIESRTVKTMGVKSLLSMLVTNRDWRDTLPIQSVPRVAVPGLVFDSIEKLVSDTHGNDQGAHTVYLSPSNWRQSVLAPLCSRYPESAGIKLVRRMGTADDPYVTRYVGGAIQEKALGNHRDQILVMNRLLLDDVGPRLIDLIEIDGGEATCIAYIVEHAPSSGASVRQCEEMVARIRNLIDQGVIMLVNWNGFSDKDFECPGCNGNLLVDQHGQTVYVDTQSFRLVNYGNSLKKTALDAQSQSHFGDKSHLLGGRYLYQAIPGIGLPAKRDPASRMEVVDRLLEEGGVSIEGRPVFDIGCNLGQMGAQYLNRAALWLHGWDMPNVVVHSEKVLRSIGCTRFSLEGTHLSSATELSESVPEFVLRQADTAIVSYLAIRGHIGWLPSLGILPWEFMLYEGHEEEDVVTSHAHIEELSKMIPVKIVAESSIQDGTSLKRYVALIQRLEH